MADVIVTDERLLATPAGAALVALKIVLARTLTPVPENPADHLASVHAEVRPSLLRLGQHDAGTEVPANRGRFAYTPRKVLRRVVDHALDHLNQIDQWLAWQDQGRVPTPTDGWAPSSITLDEDRVPLSDADLGAWMWRVDQTTRLVIQRASLLSENELDWAPPDGGWTLRRVVHHVASAEWLYATALEELLPDEAVGRYREASRRFNAALSGTATSAAHPIPTVYVHPNGEFYTRERAIREVLEAESILFKTGV